MTEQQQYVELIADELCGWPNPHEHLAQAIANDSFVMYGQDVINISAKTVFGIEILVRMREEENLLLPPGAFIPVLEHFEMMPALDEWVLDNVAQITAENPVPALHFVNLSAQSLVDPGFIERVARIRGRFPSSMESICFEIDESDAKSHPEETTRFVTVVKDMGCRIGLDHFGKGRVTFELLKDISADFVKIDSGLVLGLGRHDAVAVATIRAIHRICRTIGVAPIAQCVESDEVCRRLAQLGVEFAQGYQFSMPSPVERQAERRADLKAA